jgi:hypothetical protein
MTNLIQPIAHALHVAYVLLPWVVLVALAGRFLSAKRA